MASYKKLKSGWQYRVSYKENGEFRTKSANGFTTKREAQLAAAKVEEFLNKGNLISGGDRIFSDHMQQWYEIYKKGKTSVKNDKKIEHACNTVAVFFGKTKLKEIDRSKYQKFLNWYGEDHATETLRKVHTYSKMCIQDAIQDGLIDKDPTYRVSVVGKVKAKDEETKYLGEQDALRMINTLRDTWKPEYVSRTMIFVAFASGMRFSEVLGLTWDCVDFHTNTLKVNKSYDYMYSRDFIDTKTKAGNRSMVIDQTTIEYIKKWKIYQAEYYLKTGIRNPKNMVFSGLDGTPPSNNAPNKVLRKTCNKLEITPISFHGLRHTHISILLYHDVSIYSVSKRAGHSDISITQRVYTHVIKELEERDTDKIIAVYDGLYNAK